MWPRKTKGFQMSQGTIVFFTRLTIIHSSSGKLSMWKDAHLEQREYREDFHARNSPWDLHWVLPGREKSIAVNGRRKVFEVIRIRWEVAEEIMEPYLSLKTPSLLLASYFSDCEMSPVSLFVCLDDDKTGNFASLLSIIVPCSNSAFWFASLMWQESVTN